MVTFQSVSSDEFVKFFERSFSAKSDTFSLGIKILVEIAVQHAEPIETGLTDEIVGEQIDVSEGLEFT